MKAVPFDIANDWAAHPDFCISVNWRSSSGHESTVAEATVDGKPWAVRMNDFPDEPLFTLLIAGSEAMHFDDWPTFWNRPDNLEVSE